MLSTRARKDVAVSNIKVDVCVFPFDLLHLNGQALLEENLKIRRKVNYLFPTNTFISLLYIRGIAKHY